MTDIARYATLRGHALPIDSEGFLQEPNALYGDEETKLVTKFDAIGIVVLGQPGLGKSRVLQDWAADFRSTGPNHLTCEVSLMGVSDPQIFRRVVEQPIREAFGQVAEEEVDFPPGRRMLFIDELDQCPWDFRALVPALVEILRPYVPSTRVVIACRAGDFPSSIESAMTDLFPSVQILDLAPLTRADVTAWIDNDGLDSSEFQNLLVAVHGGPLAAIPVTLQLLIRLFRAGYSLQSNPFALYERGLLTLCDEHDPTREEVGRQLGRPVRTTSQERLAVAERVAAYLQLSGAAAVWMGRSGDTPDTDVSYGDLSGGEEDHLGAQFNVTGDFLRETLAVSLFRNIGADRIAPTHQSIGSLLAARYLHRHNLSESQLRSVLLSLSPTGNASIVPSLRETAAWLIGLDHARYQWLIVEDPEAVASFPYVVASAEVRRTLIDGLLFKAGTSQLRNEFAIRYEGLDHPRLTEQLGAALAHGTDQQQLLVIRIGEACRSEDFVSTLCEFAATTDSPLRSWAASAASRIDRSLAAIALRPIADAFHNDPNDDLRGSVLEACWHDSLTTAEMVERLTPVQRSNYLGPYQYFRNMLVEAAREVDLEYLLEWTRSELDGVQLDAAQFEDFAICDGLLRRAWLSSRRQELLPSIAMVLRKRLPLQMYHEIEIFNQPEEPADTNARREVVQLLLREAATSDEFTNWSGVWYFGHPAILRSSDFEWLVELAGEIPPDEGRKLVVVVGRLFDPLNLDHQRIAYDLRDSDLFGEVFRTWFEPIEIAGDVAEQLRSNLRAPRVPPSADRNLLQERLRELRNGLAESFTNTEAFWQFCWSLQNDPRTGRGLSVWSDDITQRPGYQALDVDDHMVIQQAAVHYLRNADPCDEAWLDNPSVTDKRPMAGYLAFALLDRKAPEQLDNLPRDTWSRWASTLLWFDCTIVNGGSPERKHRLLGRLKDSDPLSIIEPAIRYIRGCAEAGRLASEVLFLTSCWSDTLQLALSHELRDAIDREDSENMALLLDLLLPQADAFASAAALRQIDLVKYSPVEDISATSRRVADVLLSVDSALYWRDIFAAIQANESWGRQVVEDISRGWNQSSPLQLADSELAELYDWLLEHYPPESIPLASGFVTPAQQVVFLEEQVLRSLVERGTTASVEAISRLVGKYPERPWLARQLSVSEERLGINNWTPLSVSNLRDLFGSDRRLVGNANALLDVLSSAIDIIQRNLSNMNPLAPLLWNEHREQRRSRWRPKQETYLSDFLANQLRSVLVDRSMIINREVEISRGSSEGVGDRVDLLIEAIDRSGRSQVNRVAAVIEVKGCWNRDLVEAVDTQLVTRYMASIPTTCGIYLVFQFALEQWDPADGRRKSVWRRHLENRSFEGIQNSIDELRSSREVDVRLVTIDASRPE